MAAAALRAQSKGMKRPSAEKRVPVSSTRDTGSSLDTAVRWPRGSLADERAGGELSRMRAALDVGDGVAAEREEHLLRRLLGELLRVAAGERRLAERRDALLVAQVRGLARLLDPALGEVA